MPYVICGPCELVTYSAALWASTDVCPHCGTGLPTERRTQALWSSVQDQLADQLGGRAGEPGR